MKVRFNFDYRGKFSQLLVTRPAIIDAKSAIARTIFKVNQTDTAACGEAVKDLVYSSNFYRIISARPEVDC